VATPTACIEGAGVAGLVSVIIPAFNAQAFIGETLDSIFAQTYRDLEVIVVDDGSTDETARIVAGYGDRVTCIRQANRGRIAAPPRNVGICRSRGQFITFCDADDLWPPDRIQKLVTFLDTHPTAGLVFSDYVNFSEAGPEPRTHFATCPRLSALLDGRPEVVLDYAGRYLADENFGLTGSFMVRRDIAALEPGMDESLLSSEDFHYYFRLSRHTRTGIIRHVGLKRRMHGGNLSSNAARMYRSCIRSFDSLLASESDPEIRRDLRAQVSHFTRLLARHEANAGRHLGAARGYLQALRANPGLRELRLTLHGLARTAMLMTRLRSSGDR
jgi:glycosyltransferase involved in cell wall biosynthesis